MERLTFLPVAIVTALIAIRLELTYVGLAVLVGMAIPVVSAVLGSGRFSDATFGYVFVAAGVVLLVLSYLVCNYYGISFEALGNDRSFPKVVRRLPYFSIALLVSGITAILISIFRKQR